MVHSALKLVPLCGHSCSSGVKKCSCKNILIFKVLTDGADVLSRDTTDLVGLAALSSSNQESSFD